MVRVNVVLLLLYFDFGNRERYLQHLRVLHFLNFLPYLSTSNRIQMQRLHAAAKCQMDRCPPPAPAPLPDAVPCRLCLRSNSHHHPMYHVNQDVSAYHHDWRDATKKSLHTPPTKYWQPTTRMTWVVFCNQDWMNLVLIFVWIWRWWQIWIWTKKLTSGGQMHLDWVVATRVDIGAVVHYCHWEHHFAPQRKKLVTWN